MEARLRGIGLALLAPLLLFVLACHFAAAPSAAANEAPVIISEVAWGGTAASSADEWIELHNPTDATISLGGWTLSDGGDVQIALSGAIAPGAFFLLERTDDATVSDVTANQVYVGALKNDGERLQLRNASGNLIDSANLDGGIWPAGTGSPAFRSMERASADASDLDANWVTHDSTVRNGHDADGNPINGTPGQPNASWIPPTEMADLAVNKAGPMEIVVGSFVRYQLTVTNGGGLTATAVVVTDTLPAGLSYLSDDSGLVAVNVYPRTWQWQLGDLPPAGAFRFALTATMALTTHGTVTNYLHAATTAAETGYDNNVFTVGSRVIPADTTSLLIDSLFYDGYERLDLDEAVRLRNVGAVPIALAGWSLSDGTTTVSLPDSMVLDPGEATWLARDGDAFLRQFGFVPGAVLASWPGFANDGDEAVLVSPVGSPVDVLVYEAGDVSRPGWSGPAVLPYRAGGLFAEEGQILFRQLDPSSGAPRPDSNTAIDWAQSTSDVINGRRVQYPGWSLERFLVPAELTAMANMTIAVAPDYAFETLVSLINRADRSIIGEALTFESVAVADALAAAARRGVSVTILLEGDPVTGITEQERYVCHLLHDSSGNCWFMIRDDDARINDRYRYLHAKFLVVDDDLAVISSENLSPESLPDDPKVDGTWGRRGTLFVTDAPGVVSRLQQIFADDLAPQSHRDLLVWEPTHAVYGLPAPDFVPITVTGGTSYSVRFQPRSFAGTFRMALSHSPENSLRTDSGLLALLATAGAGDEVLVQQLSERPHWGRSNSNPETDPNPRLEAYFDAARRGARVRLLLDSYFDDPTSPVSNRATCDYVATVAMSEGIPIRCAMANPSGLGLHNKMVLVRSGGEGWVHIGSINGTELSHKGNREVAIQVRSNEAYELLATLFNHDWPSDVYVPLLFHQYRGPANRPLISEILYDPSGPDDAEFIELVNPTARPIAFDGWSIGDALDKADFEDVRRFPPGTMLASGTNIVIATSASAFMSEYGFLPDFEILDSDSNVADLIDDPAWGDPAAFLQLGNQGDEVLLRDDADRIVDSVAYGVGSAPDTVACALVSSSGYSLERFPYWRDEDDCPADFREWPLPSPGRLP